MGEVSKEALEVANEIVANMLTYGSEERIARRIESFALKARLDEARLWINSNEEGLNELRQRLEEIERLAQPSPTPVQEHEAACHRAFRNGQIAIRVLICEAIEGMSHEHNPDVQKDWQWQYCWRCQIERVLLPIVQDSPQITYSIDQLSLLVEAVRRNALTQEGQGEMRRLREALESIAEDLHVEGSKTDSEGPHIFADRIDALLDQPPLAASHNVSGSGT